MLVGISAEFYLILLENNLIKNIQISNYYLFQPISFFLCTVKTIPNLEIRYFLEDLVGFWREIYLVGVDDALRPTYI